MNKLRGLVAASIKLDEHCQILHPSLWEKVLNDRTILLQHTSISIIEDYFYYWINQLKIDDTDKSIYNQFFHIIPEEVKKLVLKIERY